MIRILTPADQPALEAFLLPRVSTSMFLLSNMRNAGIVDGPARYQGAYAAEFDGARISGVLAHYWNGNLIPQAPPAALPGLLDAVLAASGRGVKGMLGAGEMVAALAARLPYCDSDVQVDSHDLLYTLDLARLRVPESLTSGALIARRAAPADHAPMAALATGFGIELNGEPDTEETRALFAELVRAETSERRLWLIEERGVIAAKSNFNARIPEVGTGRRGVYAAGLSWSRLCARGGGAVAARCAGGGRALGNTVHRRGQSAGAARV